MSNLSVIRTRATQVNENVVAVLTDCLERARNGEFAGVTVVGVTTDGAIAIEISESNVLWHMVGGLAKAQYNMMKRADCACHSDNS